MPLFAGKKEATAAVERCRTLVQSANGLGMAEHATARDALRMAEDALARKDFRSAVDFSELGEALCRKMKTRHLKTFQLTRKLERKLEENRLHGADVSKAENLLAEAKTILPRDHERAVEVLIRASLELLASAKRCREAGPDAFSGRPL